MYIFSYATLIVCARYVTKGCGEKGLKYGRHSGEFFLFAPFRVYTGSNTLTGTGFDALHLEVLFCRVNYNIHGEARRVSSQDFFLPNKLESEIIWEIFALSKRIVRMPIDKKPYRFLMMRFYICEGG